MVEIVTSKMVVDTIKVAVVTSFTRDLRLINGHCRDFDFIIAVVEASRQLKALIRGVDVTKEGLVVATVGRRVERKAR